MNRFFSRLVTRASALVLCWPNSAIANPDGLTLYQETVKPLFQAYCVDCHGGKKTQGGLDLTKRVNMMQGGDSGSVVIVGSHQQSLLFQAVAHTVEQKMPHKKPKLSAAEIESIGRWIDLGVLYPADEIGSTADLEARAGRQMVIDDEDRAFWAFAPLRRALPPEVNDQAWVRGEIDRFVRSSQEQESLQPEPSADRRTLIRRLSFGLIGLPPAPEVVAAFVADTDPIAYEKVVDGLLASTHFGERWGRHWLDLARFGESHGYEADNDRPNAWSYRDAVIRGLNADMPYDQFVKWQLAGDEYAPEDMLALTLTGFIAAGPTITNEGGERVKWDKLDDIVSATGEAMLGLSFGCARCHDHKYDPVTARDYYGLAGIFANHKVQDVSLAVGEAAKKYEAKQAALKVAAEDAKARYHSWIKEKELVIVRDNIAFDEDVTPEESELLLGPEQPKNIAWKELRKRYAALFKIDRGKMIKGFSEELKAEEKALKKEMDEHGRAQKDLKSPFGKGMVVKDGGRNRPQAFFLERGDWRHKSKTDYQFVEVLMPSADSTQQWLKDPPKDAKTSHSRQALAEWMTDTKDGAGRLLARVIVNRLWQHHFAAGIVRTPSNFGAQGEAPTHPELLDWLAADLVDNGWSLKRTHKLLVMSAAYQQATTNDPAKLARDPKNRFLSYRRPQRLEAEAMRDAILASSGSLNPQMYGPSVKPWIPSDAIATGSTKKWPQNVKDGPATWRRSVYIYTKRSMLMPMMEAFDLPDSTRSCGDRNTTVVAPAALLMLNNEFIRDQAGQLATRVADAAEPVQRLYEIALSRPPSDEELALGKSFLAQQAQLFAGDTDIEDTHRSAALVNYCQVVMALNEFLYIR